MILGQLEPPQKWGQICLADKSEIQIFGEKNKVKNNFGKKLGGENFGGALWS